MWPLRIFVFVGSALAASACDLPRDAAGTHDRISGGTLRAGVSEQRPWVDLDGSEPSGVEPELLRELAREMGAEIEWVEGTEAALVEKLEHGDLDVVVAGIEKTSPWTKRAEPTKPYVHWNGAQRVMLVRKGENRWLLRLDRFLQSRRARARTALFDAGEP